MRTEKDNRLVEHYSPAWSEDSVRLILTPTNAARKTFFYLQEAGYFKTDEDYYTERRNLHSYLLIYTVSGRGLLKYQGESWELAAGSAVLIDCMDYHRYRCPPGEHWELLWIHFNGGSAKGYYEQIFSSGFTPFMPDQPFIFESALKRLVAVNQRKDRFTEAVSSSLIVSLLTELLFMRPDENAVYSDIPDYIKAVTRDIEQNFRNELTLDSLAEKYSVSKYHLSREFKKYTGTTVHESLITARISYAKELLCYSGKTVGEIACACGMSHVSHFIRQFEKREGLTPLAYRREWS